MGGAARAVGSAEVRRVLRNAGGDLRAAGDELGLTTQELLMILAYDITVTATTEKTRALASNALDGIQRDSDA